jgi:hypothetical protein
VPNFCAERKKRGKRGKRGKWPTPFTPFSEFEGNKVALGIIILLKDTSCGTHINNNNKICFLTKIAIIFNWQNVKKQLGYFVNKQLRNVIKQLRNVNKQLRNVNKQLINKLLRK